MKGWNKSRAEIPFSSARIANSSPLPVFRSSPLVGIHKGQQSARCEFHVNENYLQENILQLI
jgi:hypothetical protein